MAKKRIFRALKLTRSIYIALKFLSNKITIISFLVLTLACCIFVVKAFDQSNKTFEKHQNEIIKAQTNQITRFNNAYSDFYNGALKSFYVNDSALTVYLKDSLYSKTANLDSIQQTEVNKYVKSIITATSNNINYKEYAKDLKKDSLLVNKQIAQIQEDTKYLLELQFNKIQNEYETLQLWGGILTIVFLIFTFYSLFKTDDLMKQGRDGIDELNKLKVKGKDIIEDTGSKLKDLESKINTQKASINQTNEELQKISPNIQQIIENVNTAFENELGTQFKQQQDKLESLYLAYKNKFESIDTFKELESETKTEKDSDSEK